MRIIFTALLIIACSFSPVFASQDSPVEAPSPGIWDSLERGAKENPFNVYATIIFALALVHTFGHGYFLKKSKKYDEEAKREAEIGAKIAVHRREEIEARRLAKMGIRVVEVPVLTVKRNRRSLKTREVGELLTRKAGRKLFLARFFHYMGELEVIFGLWLVPLFAGMAIFCGWSDLIGYLDKLTFHDKKYVEPLFVVVVMFIASTRPIIKLAGDLVGIGARLLGGGSASWWISILCIGPMLGSFITEPAAITICASLLAKRFYERRPSEKFKYATLGILLVAVSAGGTLTHFSAPPVLMVAGAWGWDTPFMLEHFGWKAVVATCLSVAIYFAVFRGEFKGMDFRGKRRRKRARRVKIPIWLSAIHVAFLAFAVITLHEPALFFFSFCIFLGFLHCTERWQTTPSLRGPILVGFFLASLVTHGSLQTWWIEPVLTNMNSHGLFGAALVLTAFNDNAAITYLVSLIPNFSDEMKYLVMSAAIAGGGLTVMANAPNPAGIGIVSKFFEGGVSAGKLFLWAIIPTAIVCAAFLLL